MQANVTKTKLFDSSVDSCARTIIKEASVKKINLNNFELDSDFSEFSDPHSGWILPIEVVKDTIMETAKLLSGELKQEDIISELVNHLNQRIQSIN